MPNLTRRQTIGTALAGLASVSLESSSFAQSPAARRTIRSDGPWLDTAGRPIQAHGASILQVGDTFYWYGENKEKTVVGGHIWTYGIRAYSSRDLYSWKDEGLIIPPDLKNAKSPLSPSQMLDRPHILYNRQSHSFICWVKIMEADGRQTRTILESKSFTGPYRIVATGIQPLGMNAGDFDLWVDPTDQKAYMIFERVHSELIIADLTPDYKGFTGYYSTHFPRPGPPSVREAPAMFTRKGKRYLLTSGTTSYFPNPSEWAVADTIHGPWIEMGDVHPNDRSRTSFNSQISSVFKHPAKKDLYIAVADRWLPKLSAGEGFADGTFSRRQTSMFERIFSTRYDMPPQGRDPSKPFVSTDNTSMSGYVWLPIRFTDDRPSIEWVEQWSLDDYD